MESVARLASEQVDPKLPLRLPVVINETAQRQLGFATPAETRDIMRVLLWQFSKPVLYANLIAWPVAALIMHRWLHSFAYHVPLDPRLFIGVAALTLIVALVTVSTHCWHVARAKPAAALRYE